MVNLFFSLTLQNFTDSGFKMNQAHFCLEWKKQGTKISVGNKFLHTFEPYMADWLELMKQAHLDGNNLRCLPINSLFSFNLERFLVILSKMLPHFSPYFSLILIFSRSQRDILTSPMSINQHLCLCVCVSTRWDPILTSPSKSFSSPTEDISLVIPTQYSG